jgi:hypothetical protein
VILEPRFVVSQTPCYIGGFDAREPGEEVPGELACFRPGDVLQAGFLAGEGVAQRRADGLIDWALHPRLTESFHPFRSTPEGYISQAYTGFRCVR